MPGLTAAGLEIPTIDDLRETVNAKWRAAFGASMDVSDNSPDGQTIGIVVEQIALCWEALEVIVSSLDRDKAVDAFLRALCKLTGTEELPATFSTVALTLSGTPTTYILAGSLASTKSTGQQFTTTESVILAAATPWAPSTNWVAGEVCTNGGGIYLCTVEGDAASSGPGPIATTADVVDGTLHWFYVGPGTGTAAVNARATTIGPIVAAARDIVNRDTPLGGWSGVVNALDATVGRAKMTNAELRALADQEVARPGTSPKDAIRAALLEVDQGTTDPVTSVTVFSNLGDVTDADGVPPHSVEAMVRGGSDQAIRDALLANVAEGIRTHGAITGTSTDSAGKAQEMKFSRPADVLIYVAVTLAYDPATYPADGDAQVKLAIATWGNTLAEGRDVVSSAILARTFAVTGVREVQLPLISAAPTTTPVATTTIPISQRQRAVYDTTRITVTSTPGTP